MTDRRVLVVDDDADMSAMLARRLEGEDMGVVPATGGRAALIVDDDAEMRALLHDALERDGFA